MSDRSYALYSVCPNYVWPAYAQLSFSFRYRVPLYWVSITEIICFFLSCLYLGSDIVESDSEQRATSFESVHVCEECERGL